MILKNLKIFGRDCWFIEGSLSFDGDRITSVDIEEPVVLGEGDAVCAPEIVDCKGLYALPGFIDVHFHGAMGIDFCDADVEGIKKIAAYEASCGVLGICPATMTYPEERLKPVMQTAAAYCKEQDASDACESEQPCESEQSCGGSPCADLIGINMEGPFISPNKVGAQNPDFVQKPNADMLRRLDTESGGLVKLVDVAPEEDGCLQMISECREEFRFSIAHTCATYEDAQAAIKAGAAHMTHTYNAMPGITHRAAGPIVAAAEAAERDAVNNSLIGIFEGNQFHAEIITDGHHVSAPAIRVAFQLFGPEAMVIISDSCEATGMPDGTYSLGGQKIIKRDGLAFLEEDPTTIAASTTNQFECFKYAVKEAGISLEHAVRACTYNPAEAINQLENYGTLDAGKFANILLVDEDLNLVKIYNHGVEIKR